MTDLSAIPQVGPPLTIPPGSPTFDGFKAWVSAVMQVPDDQMPDDTTLQLVFDPWYQSERLRSDIVEIEHDQRGTTSFWHIRQPRHNIFVGFHKGYLDAKLPCRLLPSLGLARVA